jgi:hypothetical protein
MNWYKNAQLSTVDMIDDPKNDYLDIGHFGELDDEKDINYLWVFYDGEVISKEEDWENPVHDHAFPDLPLTQLYTGRFEESTGKLSILKPFKGPSQFRDPPESILSKLYQTFPSVKQIYKFNS